MERSPPPFFKQGPSARARLAFFALLALALLVVDSRLKMLGEIRSGIGTVLYPLQQAALVPRDMLRGGASYFVEQRRLLDDNQALQIKNLEASSASQRVTQLAAENAELRRLAGLQSSQFAQSLVSPVLYDTRDPFVRRLVLGKGTQHGVAPGMPVLDDVGVVGQITRVFPFSSEMNLITDKDQAVPVQVVRNGLRAITFGGQQPGLLDIRFLAANADIVEDDQLVTSGIDGVYPPGLPVARVIKVERSGSGGFARITCQPLAGVDRHRHLLILLAKPVPKIAQPTPADSTPQNGQAKKSQERVAGSKAQTGAVQ
jgi:rod shape-determining protein MreC